MYRFLIRDLVLTGATALLWLLAFVDVRFSVPAAIGAGVIAFQMHEWGHWLGASRSGALIAPAESLLSPFLFNFDSKANSRAQFLHMSWPGFAATALFLVLFQATLPDAHPSTELTRGIGWGLATVTVAIEVPLALWTLAGGRIPPVPVFLPGRRSND